MFDKCDSVESWIEVWKFLRNIFLFVVESAVEFFHLHKNPFRFVSVARADSKDHGIVSSQEAKMFIHDIIHVLISAHLRNVWTELADEGISLLERLEIVHHSVLVMLVLIVIEPKLPWQHTVFLQVMQFH